MELIKRNYTYIGKGVLRGCVLTLVIMIAAAIIMNFTSMSEGMVSMTILVTTLVSVVYSSVYATKKIKNKGWMIGLLVALLYMTIIYLASVIAGRDAALQLKDMWRVLLALIVGLLSGMLGINL